MNIIRVKLPEGAKRFKAFTVQDYRDFLLMSTEMKSCPDEARDILDELLDELYPDVDPVYREYVFLNVFTSSIGKTKIPLVFTCPTCGKEKRMFLNLSQQALTKITLETSGLTISFRYVRPSDDYAKTFLNAIHSVSDGDTVCMWDELDQETKDQIIDTISFEDFERVIKQMRTIKVEQRVKCCETHTISYDSLLNLFTLLLNPDELFTFYRINHVLAKSNYRITDLMSMLPVERNIAMTLVDKDLKEASK